MRIAVHPILGPAPALELVPFFFDGTPMTGHAGEPIAAALLAVGIRTLRHTRREGTPRGVYCGIGHCFECRVTVNGVPGIRSCLTPLVAGMRVESEDGSPELGGRQHVGAHG